MPGPGTAAASSSMSLSSSFGDGDGFNINQNGMAHTTPSKTIDAKLVINIDKKNMSELEASEGIDDQSAMTSRNEALCWLR